MNLSEGWKSTWPVGAVFAAPNLLAGAAAEHLGPLLFAPSPPSRPAQILHRRCFPLPEEEVAGGAAASSFNQLLVLRCREGDVSHVVFFPVGENSEEIGFLGLSSIDAEPPVKPERAEVFRQRDGFVHPGHRITGMSVVPLDSPEDDWDAGGGSSSRCDSHARGHLLSTTLYSVNCFRVEVLPRGAGQSQMPALVPTGRRTFADRVVDACWNPNFPEEMIVLLENGDLYWMKPESGCGIRIAARGEEGGIWLRCEFGAKPWLLFLASSVAVTMVDLRSRNGSKRSTMARIENPCAYTTVHSMANDRFVAFSRSRGHNFLFCVATEHHLFLYDSRQPLIPVLRWSHGMDSPNFLDFHPLRDLRPSEKFRWSSESGFAVLVGSFCNSQVSIFCCGPKEEGEGERTILPTMYAWELPSHLCLLDRQCSSADDLVREEFLKEELLPAISDRRVREELILGFSILLSGSFSALSEPEDPGGFSLLRLTSSGKLELQKYRACWKICGGHGEDSSRSRDSSFVPDNWKPVPALRHDFFNFKFLSAYLSGNLSKAMNAEMQNPGAEKFPDLAIDSRELQEIIDHAEQSRTSSSVLDFIKDVGIPTNVHEIASRRALYSLERNLLDLAFSRFSDLFSERKNSTFEFPEISKSPPLDRLLSIILRKPTNRRIRGLLRETTTKDQLVGPVLPLPVLLSLRRMQEEEEGDWMGAECREILERVFPEISIASSEVPQEANTFQIHEPGTISPGESGERQEFSVFVYGPKSAGDGEEAAETSGGLAKVKLRFDPPGFYISREEQKILGSLKRQFSTWQSAGFDLHCSSKSTKRN